MQGVLDFLELVQAVWRHWLLVPGGPVLLEPSAHRDGGRHVETTMELDHDVDGIPHGIADGCHESFGVVPFPGRQRLPGGPEGIELQPGVAELHGSCCFLGIFCRGACSAIPAVGVRRQTVVALAAEDVVQRLSECFPHEVPAGDLHAADRGHDGGTALVLVADHPGSELLHGEGIRPEDAVDHPLVEERLHGLLLPLQGCFAEPRDAGICRQAEEQVIAETRVGEERLEPCDLHRRPEMRRSAKHTFDFVMAMLQGSSDWCCN